MYPTHPMHPERGRRGRDPFDPFDATDPRARRRRGDFPPDDGTGPSRRGRPDGGGPRGGRPRRGGGPGFDPWSGPERGPRGPHGRGRGRRAGRGEIRAAVLLLLAERPMHGYQVITELSDRTDGRWRPSPGAVYPAISQLQDEGLVAVTDDGGRRLASLTDAGREHVESHREELGSPWETYAAADPLRRGHELHAGMRALGGAVEQVARAGTAEQAEAAAAVLDRARRDIYLLLAGPAHDTTDGPTDGPTDG